MLVLVIAVVVVLAAAVIGWLLLRPWTIGQVFGLAHYTAGNELTVAGTITGINRLNTSYGPRVELALDGNSMCSGEGHVLGDPNATYHLGDPFQTTLHFRAYTINGNPAVSAPELACPFPAAFQAIGTVMDSVSQAAGIVLSYNETLAGGWQVYDISTENGLTFNGSVLPVTLRKAAPIQGSNPELPAGSTIDSAGRWSTLASLEYVQISGGYQAAPVVDRMASITGGSSANGTLRFVDAHHDGLVDDGDRLEVLLPDTAAATTWDTYLLQIGSMFSTAPPTYVAGIHYILNGPNGPLEVLASSKPTRLEFRSLGDQMGPPVQTTVEVARVAFGSPPALGPVEVRLTVNDSNLLSANLTSLPTSTGGGLTLSFVDANGNGRLDAGDRFVVTGAGNHTRLFLELTVSGVAAGAIEWIVGYGVPFPVIPDVSFSVQGTGPWTITAAVPSWSPELALNRTLRASLWENGLEVVTNASLTTGTIGTFTNGTLSFSDADANGFLSTGDAFALRGNPTARYELRISLLFTSWLPPIDV